MDLLPQRRQAVRQVSVQKRNVPLEQIIAVEGQNPLATGIETAGNVIGQAIAKRAELRRQGQELARLEAAYNLQPGELSGIQSTETASTLGKYMAENRKPTYVQQINPDGTATLLEIPAGGKFGGIVRTPSAPNSPKTTLKGVTPNGEPVSYNPVTRRNELSDGTPYIGTILSTTMGSEETRRNALVTSGSTALSNIRSGLAANPSAFSELKAIRLSPGRSYSQISSGAARDLFTNLQQAIQAKTYLESGATLNPIELENATISYLAAISDAPADFIGRLSLLESFIAPYNTGRGKLSPLPKPTPKGVPVETPEQRKARLIQELQAARR